MGFLIGILAALGCFAIMSKTSKVVCILILIGSLAYGYGVSYHVNGYGPENFQQVKNLFNLYSLNIGAFTLAVILGIMRHASDSDDLYLERKKKFFTFTVKWGIIYGVYSFIGQKIINNIYHDDTAGFFVMRVFGIFGFGILLLLYLGARHKLRNKEAKSP